MIQPSGPLSPNLNTGSPSIVNTWILLFSYSATTIKHPALEIQTLVGILNSPSPPPCFPNLFTKVVFLDELLEFEYYCLLLETNFSSLCCNRFNSWFTILFVHFLLTCVFLVQIRFQLELSWSILRLGIPLQRGTSRRGGVKPFTDQIRNGRGRSGCGHGSIDLPTSCLFREALIQSNPLISVHDSKEKKKLLYFSILI